MAKKKRYPEQATSTVGETHQSSVEDKREVHISERLIGMLEQIRTAHPVIEPRVAGRSSAAAGAGASALSWIGLFVALGTLGLSLFLFFQWKESQKQVESLQADWQNIAKPVDSPGDPLVAVRAGLEEERVQRQLLLDEIRLRINGLDASLENLKASPFLNPAPDGQDPRRPVTQAQWLELTKQWETRVAKDETLATKVNDMETKLSAAGGVAGKQEERLTKQDEEVVRLAKVADDLGKQITSLGDAAKAEAKARAEADKKWEELLAMTKEFSGKSVALEKKLAALEAAEKTTAVPASMPQTVSPDVAALALALEDLTCDIHLLKTKAGGSSAAAPVAGAEGDPPPNLAALAGQMETLVGELKKQGDLAAQVKGLQAELAKTAALSAEIETLRQQMNASKPEAVLQSQLLYIKERDRYNAYADRAIAAGDRKSWESLLQLGNDTNIDSRLRDAARAELFRVRSFYLAGPRLVDFMIPVDKIFPEAGHTDEAKLTPPQLAGLMLDPQVDWRIRSKAAFLMGKIKHPDAARALLDVIKGDENLDVMKEAMFSFSMLTGYRGEVFDVASVLEWWTKEEAAVLQLLKTTP